MISDVIMCRYTKTGLIESHFFLLINIAIYNLYIKTIYFHIGSPTQKKTNIFGIDKTSVLGARHILVNKFLIQTQYVTENGESLD